MTSRRTFLCLSAAWVAAAALLHAGSAPAQDYPSRPVRWLIGFAPGGPNDILARIIGQHLSEKLGQPFVIETRPGAGGNLATREVAGAAPDGHTLLGIGHFNAINATLYQKLPFDFVRDIVPVAAVAQAPNVLMIHPSLPAKTVTELIAYLKANPGKLSYRLVRQRHVVASGGRAVQGDDRHSMQHVPYRGTGPVLIDLLSGRCRCTSPRRSDRCHTCRTASCARSAVTTARSASTCCRTCPRSPQPCRATRSPTWFGVGAPKATPPAIVERLNREINAALDDPKIKARLADLGGAPFVATLAADGRVPRRRDRQWGRAVKFSGAKVD